MISYSILVILCTVLLYMCQNTIILLPVTNLITDSNLTDLIYYTGIKILKLKRRFVLFWDDFSLRMCISAIFLLTT